MYSAYCHTIELLGRSWDSKARSEGDVQHPKTDCSKRVTGCLGLLIKGVNWR